MKEKTYKLIPCNSFDARELQQWLSEEAAAGYFFQSGTTTWIQFREDTPKAGVTYILQPDAQKRRLHDERLRYLRPISCLFAINRRSAEVLRSYDLQGLACVICIGFRICCWLVLSHITARQSAMASY